MVRLLSSPLTARHRRPPFPLSSYLAHAGSRLYGTNTSESDVDIKGIFVPASPSAPATTNVREKHVPGHWFYGSLSRRFLSLSIFRFSEIEYVHFFTISRKTYTRVVIRTKCRGQAWGDTWFRGPSLGSEYFFMKLRKYICEIEDVVENNVSMLLGSHASITRTARTGFTCPCAGCKFCIGGGQNLKLRNSGGP